MIIVFPVIKCSTFTFNQYNTSNITLATNKFHAIIYVSHLFEIKLFKFQVVVTPLPWPCIYIVMVRQYIWDPQYGYDQKMLTMRQYISQSF
jgi:hypothetical protein